MFFLHIALTCQLPVECRWRLKTLSLLGMFYRNTGHITTYMELHFHTTTVNFKVIYLRGWSNQLSRFLKLCLSGDLLDRVEQPIGPVPSLLGHPLPRVSSYSPFPRFLSDQHFRKGFNFFFHLPVTMNDVLVKQGEGRPPTIWLHWSAGWTHQGFHNIPYHNPRRAPHSPSPLPCFSNHQQLSSCYTKAGRPCLCGVWRH